MHARLEANLIRQPLPLKPIPWGKPDKALASGVLHSVAATTPRHALPFNPIFNRKLRAFLNRYGFAN